MPNVHLAEGSAIGAHSFVTTDTDAWSIYAGSPAKKIKSRKRNPLQLEQSIR
jgi:galactoside O-acetyltransferase